MATSFRKGPSSTPGVSKAFGEVVAPPKSAEARMIKPVQRSQLEMDRLGLKGLSEAELLQRIVHAYDSVWEVLHREGKWASGYDTHLFMRRLGEHINVITFAYTALDDAARERARDLCDWEYAPIQVGRITYLEWILFVVSQVFWGIAGGEKGKASR